MKKNYSNIYRDCISLLKSFRAIYNAKLFAIILTTFFLLGFNTSVKSQSGIFESYVIIDSGFGNNYYDLNPQTQTGNFDFNNTFLGTFNSLSNFTLKGGQNRIYKCGSDDITSGWLNYTIYPTGSR